MLKLDHLVVLSLLGLYTGKALVRGANPADAAVILILAAAHFLYNSQIQNKKVHQLSQVVEQQNEDIEEMKKRVQDVVTSVAGVKISQGFIKKA
jgi:cell division protein FtsB